MPNLEKVICGLVCCSQTGNCLICPYFPDDDSPVALCDLLVMSDAITLLREQKEERARIVNWLGKFCAHADRQYEPLFTDEQNIEWFRQKMKQQFGWEVNE